MYHALFSAHAINYNGKRAPGDEARAMTEPHPGCITLTAWVYEGMERARKPNTDDRMLVNAKNGIKYMHGRTVKLAVISALIFKLVGFLGSVVSSIA